MTIGFNLISISNTTVTGTFTFLKNIIVGLKDYKISDCKFIVYKQKHIPKEYFRFPDNIDIQWVDVPNLGSGIKRIVFEQTLFYLYIRKCDLLFSHCTSLPLFVKSTKIFTLHDVYFKEFSYRYSKVKTFMLDIITKLYLKKTDKVITVSEYSKQSILKYYDINPEKFAVIYNFLPQSIENCCINIPNIKLETIKQSFLYVGSIQPGKNIKGMIDGFLKFSEDNPNYSLIIVGKPTYLGKNIINSIPKESNLYYLGYQPGEVVSYLQKNCLATVLLSFCEGFGIPPLEGFKFGKPSLVSNVTSLPEVVGNAGVCVNPYDTDSIAKGYSAIIKDFESYQNNISVQLAKFDKTNIMNQFLNFLDIEFSPIEKTE